MERFLDKGVFGGGCDGEFRYLERVGDRIDREALIFCCFSGRGGKGGASFFSFRVRWKFLRVRRFGRFCICGGFG